MKKTEKIISRLSIITILIFVTMANIFSQARFITPKNSDTLTSGTNIELKFNNTSKSILNLSYSNDNNNWNTISNNISDSNFSWIVPSLDTGKLYLRLNSSAVTKPYLIWEYKNAHNFEVRSIDISPDGNYILSLGKDDFVKIIDIKTKSIIKSVNIPGTGTGLYNAKFIHSIDTILISGGTFGYIWIVSTNQLKNFVTFASDVRAIAIHPTRNIIAIGSYDGTLKIFDCKDLTKSIFDFSTMDNSNIYTTSFNKQGNLLSFAGSNGKIYVYDWENNTRISLLNGHGLINGDSLIWSTDFSPDSKLLVSGGVDKTVKLWDLKSNKLLWSIQAHSFHIRNVMFHPTGNYILSGSLDQFVKQWDLNGAEVTDSINHTNQVLVSGYFPTGDTIYSAGRGDNAIMLWKNFDGKDYSDTLTCYIKYPVRLSVSSTYNIEGKSIKIPVLFESTPNVDTPKNLGLNAQLNFINPNELLDLNNFSKNQGFKGKTDTVTFNINNFIWKDTVFIINALTLQGDNPTETIKIDKIDFDKQTNYYLLTGDAIVGVSPVCGSSKINKINLTKENFGFIVSPNPVSSETIKLNLSAIEDGKYKIELTNIAGSRSDVLFNGEIKSGKKEFDFKIQNIPNGEYFIRVASPTQIKTQAIVILR